MKKTFFFLMTVIPLMNKCVGHGKLKKAQSSPAILFSGGLPLKKHKVNNSNDIPEVTSALMLLFHGKKYRKDHELTEDANQSSILAKKVNRGRQLEQDSNEFSFVKKIVSRKNDFEENVKITKSLSS